LISTETQTPADISRYIQGVSGGARFDRIDPLTDARWPDFLQWHPRATVFHSPSWLRALNETYGYRPIVYTTSLPGQPLRDGVVFCEVKTWLVRPRLVSLPFSDHAEPLISNKEDLEELLRLLGQGVAKRRWTSIELRPLGSVSEWPEFREGQQFVVHTLNLEPALEALFKGLNKDSTQRKIRRAARLGLKYEEGQSEQLLEAFFRLVLMTRRRKALPPPPIEWFRNVVRHLGDHAKIRIARTVSGEAAGGILTLSFKDSMVFKYGASDVRFHSLGTMPFLLWQAIEDAKGMGATTFDFGRSDVDHTGLIRFKDHFGAERTPLRHKIHPARSWEPRTRNWKLKVASRVFGQLPDSALILAGRLIYPHIG